MSKPMIYSYFGDKEELYKAALRESYVQIREGERKLKIGRSDPEDAIRELVDFTLEPFRFAALVHLDAEHREPAAAATRCGRSAMWTRSSRR